MWAGRAVDEEGVTFGMPSSRDGWWSVHQAEREVISCAEHLASLREGDIHGEDSEDIGLALIMLCDAIDVLHLAVDKAQSLREGA